MSGMPSTCMSCLAGYILSGSSCMASNCSLSKSCSYCPMGSGLMASQDCQTCQVANCAMCNLFSNCTQCMDGFYRTMNNACVACPANCFYCTAANTCSVCMAGHTMQYFPAAVGSLSMTDCVACDSSCATCVGHPSVCFSCSTGYILFGTQCMTKTYFSGSISFNVSFSVFEADY